MSVEDLTLQSYYGYSDDEPIVEPLETSTAASTTTPTTVSYTTPATSSAIDDKLMLSFMVFGTIIAVVTVFGIALMYRGR